MSEEKWTIVLIKQKGTPPNITRYVDQIISPGTSLTNSEEYNFIASIYISKSKQDIFYGAISLADISLGKIFVFENFGTKDDPNLPIDEIEQIVRTHNIKEFIFTFETEQLKEIVSLFNPYDKPCLIKTEKEVRKQLKIDYINQLFERTFDTDGFLSPIEFLNLEKTPFIVNSLSILITFLIEHNNLISSNFNEPEFLYSNRYMYLGNNPIEQLDIYSKDTLSVLDIINKGITAIGKRYITEQILNPLYDKEKILKRYNNSETFIKSPYSEKIRVSLKNVYDIEKLWRKIELRKINPFELYNFYTSIKNIYDIYNYTSQIKISSKKKINHILSSINSYFDITKLSKYNLQNIEESFILKNVSPEIDKLQNKYEEILKEIEGQQYPVKYTDLEGHFFEIKKYNQKDFPDNHKIRKLKNSTKVFTEDLTLLSKEFIQTKNALIALVKKEFDSFIIDFQENKEIIKEIVYLIAELDFYLNNERLYRKNYIKPEITKEEIIEAIELRHPITETIEEHGLFIPNNITLGKKKYIKNPNKEIFDNSEEIKGFLLYGINSSGKTILTKSLGISIILAQAGVFVPASHFRFSLRESLFTRITGKDSLVKGLSTFAVEMLELKNIFFRSNEKSLILGDEISHGTETISGISIVSATIQEIVNKKSFFILSTHLHQLETLKALKDLKTLSRCHLSIKYEESKDLIIYDRKIKRGKGSSVYGLEFAKSLKLPKSFLVNAYKTRDIIAPDLEKERRLINSKSSKYNKKVLLTECYVCGNKAEETHHIKEQHLEKEGFIDGIRKNHKHNLVPLCCSCHDKVHKKEIVINGFKQTDKGLILDFSKNN
jgi:DNA mismatch repair protein MutS